MALLEAAFAARPAAVWLSLLEVAAVPCAPIRSMDEVFAAPEGAALVERIDDPGRHLSLPLVRSPIRLDGAPLPIGVPPPLLGEHTDEVLGGP